MRASTGLTGVFPGRPPVPLGRRFSSFQTGTDSGPMFGAREGRRGGENKEDILHTLANPLHQARGFESWRTESNNTRAGRPARLPVCTGDGWLAASEYLKSPERHKSPDLDQSLQERLGNLLLIGQREFLLGHEDAVAAVKLEVSPPRKEGLDGFLIHMGKLIKKTRKERCLPRGVALGADPNGFQDATGSQLLDHPSGIEPGRRAKIEFLSARFIDPLALLFYDQRSTACDFNNGQKAGGCVANAFRNSTQSFYQE